MSVVGDNIRALRALYGNGHDITQTELAQIAGVTRETVNKWEAGTIGNVRTSNMDRLRKHFGLTVDDLRSETNGLAARLRAEQDKKGGGRTSVSMRSHAVHLVGLAELQNESVLSSLDETIEVPSLLFNKPRKLCAFVMEDDAMALVLPKGSHVVVDLSSEPKSGTLVVVVVPGVFQSPVVRRLHCGATKAILSSEGIRVLDDIVLDLTEICIVGTVVWYQSPTLLGQ